MIKSELNLECGVRLKECLDEFPMTQNELSELTGYTQQYISNIVVGKKPMTIKAAKLFSQHLHVRQEYLLCEDDFRTDEEEIMNENDSSLSDCQHILRYLKTLGIAIKPLIAYPADEDIKDYNFPIYGENIIDKNGKEFYLLEFPYTSKFLPKNTNSVIFRMMEQDSMHFIAVEAHDIKKVISLKEFGHLMKEIDAFVNFGIRNFLNNHLFSRIE